LNQQRVQGSQGFIVRRNIDRLRAVIAHEPKPACDAVTRLTLPRPPHPVPTFATMANAPLFATEWLKLVEVICPTAQAKYFSRNG
jgi:hypothetical protein